MFHTQSLPLRSLLRRKALHPGLSRRPELRQALGRLTPNGVLHRRRPAQQQPLAAQGLTRPPPQVELVAMLDDLAVAKDEVGLDTVDHSPSGLAEQVGIHPLGAA